MCEPILRSKVHVVLAGELRTVVCVTDKGDTEPGKVSFGFADNCFFFFFFIIILLNLDIIHVQHNKIQMRNINTNT